ncbi:MAG TPA: hypothetical protein VEP89_16825, partial [Draconibacterium sp.]|nr:hypothetical protein [Draconibacterium sp.]
SVEECDRFFVELDGLLVPFFVEKDGFRFRSSKSAIVKFDWVDDEKYAKRLIGAGAYLFHSEIIDEQDETESTFEGLMLIDSKLGEIGAIDHVDDYSGNIVFTVSYRGEELLIPFHEEMLVSYNEIENSLTLNLPEGLIDC